MKIDPVVNAIVRSGLVKKEDREKLYHVVWASIEEENAARDLRETEMDLIRARLEARYERRSGCRVWLDEMIDIAFPESLCEPLNRVDKSSKGRVLGYYIAEMFKARVIRARHGDRLVRVVHGVARKWTQEDEDLVDYMLGIKSE